MTNPNQNAKPGQSYDAQQWSEEIAEGDQQPRDIDVGADYEASKKFTQSDPGEDSTSPGNPEDFRNMAKDIAENQ